MKSRILFCALPAVVLLGCGDRTTPGATPAESARVPSELELKVRSALSVIRGPEAGHGADMLLVNRHLTDTMTTCMVEAGFQFMPVPFSLPPSMKIRHGASAKWVAPPNEEQALRGFGSSFDTALYDRQRGYKEPPGVDPDQMAYIGALSDADRQRYFAAAEKCSLSIAETSHPALALSEQLAAQAGEIASRAMKTEGFGRLRKAYQRCVRDNEMDFDDPAEAAASAREMDGEEAAEYDRSAAIVDFRCRSPLYGEFVALAADEWKAWLEASSDDRERLDREWSDLLEQAGLD